jgi:hypothetical protein
MNDRTLARILRDVLAASTTVPIACAIASCGGRAIEPASTSQADAAEDVQTVDASPLDSGNDTTQPCAGQGCGLDCAAGCTMVAECIGDVLQCSCTCPSDGSVVDAVVKDASDAGDASNPCDPDHNQCPYYVPFYCLDGAAPDAGSTSQAECAVYCSFSSPSTGFCNVGTDPSGEPAVECYAQCGIGRRPAGMARPRRRRGSVPGRYFAAAAKLEAASVDAFHGARAQLAAFGAPARLLRACERAARDEVRHARSQATLARHHGVEARMPRSRSVARRTLVDFALENAIEGCVRETYGALVALRQAEHASDPRVRDAMRRIAADETRHAALSWRIARWLQAQLDPGTRAMVSRAQRRAVRDLRRTATREPPRALTSIAGLPGADEAVRLVDALDRMLWLTPPAC